LAFAHAWLNFTGLLMKGLSMSTRFARSTHHPIRSAAKAVPLAGRQRKLLLILALGLLASVAHPLLAHA